MKMSLKKSLKQMAIVYPSVFAALLFAFGVVHASSSDGTAGGSFTLVMDEPIPFGSALASPDPVSCREEVIDSIGYVFVYEKETQQYLVYEGFDCLGRISLEYGDSLDDYTGNELLGLMRPLAS
jgi:hypothetical protein